MFVKRACSYSAVYANYEHSIVNPTQPMNELGSIDKHKQVVPLCREGHSSSHITVPSKDMMPPKREELCVIVLYTYIAPVWEDKRKINPRRVLLIDTSCRVHI